MTKLVLKKYQADLVLLLVAIIWGSIFAITKNTLSYVGPLFIIAVRFSISAIVLILLFRKKLKTIRWKDLPGGIIVGGILFGALITQLVGLKYTTASKQAFLIGTYVVLVPFLYWLTHKTKPGIWAILGAFMCLTGTSLLTLNQGFSISFGDSITLFSGVFYAAHLVTTEYFAKKDDLILFLIIQFSVVAVLSTVSALLVEPLPVGLSSSTIFSLLYLSVVCTLITYFLQVLGQKYTVSTHASLILSTEAVFGSLLAVQMLGEHFTFKMLLSCGIIFTAILVTEVKSPLGENQIEAAISSSSEKSA